MTEPRNFSWFVEGLIAGMGYPKGRVGRGIPDTRVVRRRHFDGNRYSHFMSFFLPLETDIPFLASVGIKTLINMTRDNYYAEVAEAHGVTVQTIYVPDFEPPSVEQIREFLQVVDSAKEVS